ncbi:MAG: efflux RND transporter periplasmic adaptor subunit [Phycisphaera sp.]|nr:efflux RND transporter periplasmic adaptor subunit [Phycisphaera sp.]
MKRLSMLILPVFLVGLSLWPSRAVMLMAQHADDHADPSGHAHTAQPNRHGPDGQDDHAGHDPNEDPHDDHAHHPEHGDHHDEGVIRISPEVMREFGIEVRAAEGGSIQSDVRLPGEVVFNADRMAHVTPTVTGIVRRVHVSVGDHVEAGQVLATLNSRELAAARSEYLTAIARLVLAEANLARDQRLFEDQVGTERAAIESRQAREEARITLNQAENALHALGVSHEQASRIDSLGDTDFNTYELTAPLAGVVTHRHITVGELVEPGGESPFTVADLTRVWVNLTVYPRDLALVKKGQHVTVTFGHDILDAGGQIVFVSPSLDEKTRTATARVVLPNPEGHWRPGLFVEGRIEIGSASAAVVVPRAAITELDGKPSLFIQTDAGFEPRSVTVGRTTPVSAEIVAGLEPGERYVARNVLALTAELNRAALEHAGHAH